MFKKKAAVGAAVVLLVLVAIAAFNWISVTGSARDVVSQPGNQKIDAWAYHRWGVAPRTIVFDLHGIAGDSSAADVMRVLLQFASRVKETEFDRVYLSWRGQARFMLDGDYFQKLGREYGLQNPVYTLRTFPENVKSLDGLPAFSQWSGGLLGVVGGQMNDLLDLSRRWFMDDAMSDMR